MFKKLFYSNTRKRKGFLGNIMINKMNIGHAKLSDWGLSHLKSVSPVSIADLGCGGGINVAKLIKLFPGAKVTGFDYSSVSVKKSNPIIILLIFLVVSFVPDAVPFLTNLH